MLFEPPAAQRGDRQAAGPRWLRWATALTVMATVYAVTLLAAWRTGRGLGPVTVGIEGLSAASANSLRTIAGVLPLGYASPPAW